MIDKAREFATKAHDGQFRKGTKRPYIVHPIEVGDIVSTMTTDEEVISAAILHDTIEDCEGVTERMLAELFSARVAGMVAPGERRQVQNMDGAQKRYDRAPAYSAARSADDRTGRQAVQYAGY